jgi:hypothetical protein
VDNSPQNDQYRPPPVNIADLVCGLDQPEQFGCRIVRGDPTGHVTEQILAIFKTDAGCSEPSTECMLQVMDADLGKVRSVSGMRPTRFEHPLDRLSSK